MKYSELNEKKPHGSQDFPIEYYFVDRSHPQYVMPAHWHTEAELLCVREGTLMLHLNRRQYVLHRGDLAFINSGTVHRGEPQDCIYECAVFKPEMLLQSSGTVNRLLSPLVQRQCAVRELFTSEETPHGVAEQTDLLFSHLREQSKHAPLAVYSALYALFHAFYEADAITTASHGKAQERQLQQLTKLLGWIEEHYTERISLSSLARAAGINEKYLCRFFRTYTDSTPIEYINRLRVERAAYDIRFRNYSVTEAAYANGFNDSAYFCKLFRTFLGVTPGAYKREGKKDT